MSRFRSCPAEQLPACRLGPGDLFSDEDNVTRSVLQDVWDIGAQRVTVVSARVLRADYNGVYVPDRSFVDHGRTDVSRLEHFALDYVALQIRYEFSVSKNRFCLLHLTRQFSVEMLRAVNLDDVKDNEPSPAFPDQGRSVADCRFV